MGKIIDNEEYERLLNLKILLKEERRDLLRKHVKPAKYFFWGIAFSLVSLLFLTGSITAMTTDQSSPVPLLFVGLALSVPAVFLLLKGGRIIRRNKPINERLRKIAQEMSELDDKLFVLEIGK